MSADLRPARCETCAHWTREPVVATGTSRPDGADPHLGACHLYPPNVIRDASGFILSLFPEVHAHRFCGDWMTNWTPEGDGGEEASGDNVVHLRGAA